MYAPEVYVAVLEASTGERKFFAAWDEKTLMAEIAEWCLRNWKEITGEEPSHDQLDEDDADYNWYVIDAFLETDLETYLYTGKANLDYDGT